MTMFKKDDKPSHQKSRVFCIQRIRFLFKHLTLKKSLKTFIKTHIPDARFIIS